MEINVLRTYLIEAVINQADVRQILSFDLDATAKLYDETFHDHGDNPGIYEKCERLVSTVELAYMVLEACRSFGVTNPLWVWEVPLLYNRDLPVTPYFTEAKSGSTVKHYLGPISVANDSCSSVKLSLPRTALAKDWHLFHAIVTRGLFGVEFKIVIKDWK